MIKKSYLEAPQAELILVRFEEAVLGPSNTGESFSTQTGDEDMDDWD